MALSGLKGPMKIYKPNSTLLSFIRKVFLPPAAAREGGAEGRQPLCTPHFSFSIERKQNNSLGKSKGRLP